MKVTPVSRSRCFASSASGVGIDARSNADRPKASNPLKAAIKHQINQIESVICFTSAARILGMFSALLVSIYAFLKFQPNREVGDAAIASTPGTDSAGGALLMSTTVAA